MLTKNHRLTTASPYLVEQTALTIERFAIHQWLLAIRNLRYS